jgi:hypothetical protein
MIKLRTLAAKVDVGSQLFLDHAYVNENSIVRRPDHQEAMKWLKRASSQYSGEGSARLAELYE